MVNGEVVSRRWIHQYSDFDTFRIFGFLDAFNLECGLPKDTTRARGILLDLQQAVYSGYQKMD